MERTLESPPKKSFRWQPTIRSSLIILVLVCLIPATLAEAGLTYYSFSVERKNLLTDTLARTKALTVALDREMSSATGAIRALGTSPSLTLGNYKSFYEEAKEVQTQQQADNIVLSTPSGQQIINTLRPYGSTLPVTRLPDFEKNLQSRFPIITPLFVGAVSVQPHFVIQISVRQNDRVVGVLAIGMFPQRVADILPREGTLNGQISGILDSNGVIVARAAQREYIGRKVRPELLAQITQMKEGYVATITADGTPAILLFSRSDTSGWTTYITIPQSFIAHKLWDALKWVVAIPLLLALVVLLFAWRAGGAIAKSITDLTAPALSIGYGQQLNIAPLYLKEADQVGRALVEASTLLRIARYEAQHDKLTNLANRALFNDMVQQQKLLCERMRISMAILYIDLDGFKAVNDTHGHGVGDELLCLVSSRLTKCVRSCDVVARLGGDEFAILLTASGSIEASVVAEKVVVSVSEPYSINGLIVLVSASIGIASFPDTGTTPEELLKAADEAMYHAKKAGKKGYVVATSTTLV